MAKYKIRPLIGKDFFRLSRFFQKLGIKRIEMIFNNKEICEAFNGALSGHGNISEIGRVISAFVPLLLDCICDIEDELYSLLENVSDLGKEEIENLPMSDFADMAEELFKRKEIIDFFGRFKRLFAGGQTKLVKAD